MLRRPRSAFVLTVAASASLAACGSSSPEPEPVHTVNPPEVEVTSDPVPEPIPPPRNPPPPLSECPPNGPPEVGQGCVGDLVCHYGSTDPCDADYVELRCVERAFQVSPRPTCNPPAPMPPAATSKR